MGQYVTIEHSIWAQDIQLQTLSTFSSSRYRIELQDNKTETNFAGDSLGQEMSGCEKQKRNPCDSSSSDEEWNKEPENIATKPSTVFHAWHLCAQPIYITYLSSNTSPGHIGDVYLSDRQTSK